MTAIMFLLGMLCAYLAGSINFAILLFRLIGKDDPRMHFSGNAGVTNVYRQAGWPLAALVLILDMGRAMGVALLIGQSSELPRKMFAIVGSLTSY